jgi:hypothetical protein
LFRLVAEGFTEKWHDECGAAICDKDWGSRTVSEQAPQFEIHSVPQAGAHLAHPSQQEPLRQKAIAWGLGDFLDFESLWQERPAVAVSVAVLTGVPCFLVGLVVGRGGRGRKRERQGKEVAGDNRRRRRRRIDTRWYDTSPMRLNGSHGKWMKNACNRTHVCMNVVMRNRDKQDGLGGQNLEFVCVFCATRKTTTIRDGGEAEQG